MQILVIIYEYPPVGGGGGRSAQNICVDLAKRGHDVRVITSHYKDLPRQETREGIQIMRVFSARREPYRADLLTMYSFIISGIIAAFRTLQTWKPDIMHVHFAVPSGPVAWFLSLWTHIPYVLTAHLGDVPEGVPEKTRQWVSSPVH